MYSYHKIDGIVVTQVSDPLLPMKPHTKAKHKIIEEYLKGWFPILSSWNNRIVYLDGFSGPGLYDDGSYGSPVIALEVAKTHRLKLAKEVIFYFIEKEKDRLNYLKELLDSKYLFFKEDSYKELPANFKVHIVLGEFNEVMTSILKAIEKKGTNLASTFAFIDPFGYSDINVNILGNILSFEGCELLITYMVGFLDRFVYDQAHKDSIKQAFLLSDEELNGVVQTKDSEEREKLWLRLLICKLEGCMKTEGLEGQRILSLSFRVRDKMNRTMYYLVYFTKNTRGLELMKESMWKVGKEGNYVFSDYNFVPSQTSILDYCDEKMWIKEASEELHYNFMGKVASVEEIKNYVLINTPWIWRKSILKLLEENGKIEAIGQRARKYVYPDNVSIKFI